MYVKYENTAGHAGRITRDKSDAIITVDTKIKEAGRINFTIAHEVAHNFLDDEDKLLCSYADIFSQSFKKREADANKFAAELLIPEKWVRTIMNWEGNAISTLDNGARIFGATLSCTAIRYSKYGKIPLAVICTENGIIKWKSISENFPYQYVKAGDKVSNYTKAFEFYEGRAIDKEPSVISASAWFYRDRYIKGDKYLIEQNIAMKNYNSVLTIVWEG